MKTDDPDQDLHAAFTRQRQADHAEAPAWRPSCLDIVTKPGRTSHLRLAGLIGAAACVAFALAVVLSRPEPAPSLVKHLPILLSASTENDPLLANVEARPLDSLNATSDFLLPSHLTISMP